MATATRVRLDGMFWGWIKAQADKEGMEPRAWMKKALGYPLLEGDDEVYDFVVGKINGRALVRSGLSPEYIHDELLKYVHAILRLHGLQVEDLGGGDAWNDFRIEGLYHFTNPEDLVTVLDKYPELHPIVAALFHNVGNRGAIVKNVTPPSRALKELGNTAKRAAEELLHGSSIDDVSDKMSDRTKAIVAAELLRHLGFTEAAVGGEDDIVLWVLPVPDEDYRPDTSYDYCVTAGYTADKVIKTWPMISKIVNK